MIIVIVNAEKLSNPIGNLETQKLGLCALHYE